MSGDHAEAPTVAPIAQPVAVADETINGQLLSIVKDYLEQTNEAIKELSREVKGMASVLKWFGAMFTLAILFSQALTYSMLSGGNVGAQADAESVSFQIGSAPPAAPVPAAQPSPEPQPAP